MTCRSLIMIALLVQRSYDAMKATKAMTAMTAVKAHIKLNYWHKWALIYRNNCFLVRYIAVRALNILDVLDKTYSESTTVQVINRYDGRGLQTPNYSIINEKTWIGCSLHWLYRPDVDRECWTELNTAIANFIKVSSD